MKKIYRLTLSAIGLGMALLPGKSWAQTGIGTGGSAPNASAMLEVQSASKGLLIPRLSLSSVTDAVTIAAPATSLLVWNTNNSLTAGVGYYFNAGTPASPNWVKLVTNAPGDGTGNEWKLGGNTTGVESKFGTNDAFDLPFITSGAERARLTTAGQFGIGTATPKSTLEVAGSLGANYAQVTDATYAVSNADFYVVYNGTAPGTFTLPTAVGVKGRIFYIKNTTSAQPLTVVTQSGEGINGTSSLSIPAGKSVQLIASGASSASITAYEVVAFNSATTIGGPQTVSNGLTLLGTDVQLGGQLTKNTIIDGAGAYTLGLTNTTLGVGTGTPGATLHIVGSTASGSPGGTGAEVLLGTTSLTKGASMQILDDGSHGSSLLFNVKKGSTQGGSATDNWPVGVTTPLRIGAAGSGNVGIGAFTGANPVHSGALLHLRNSAAAGTDQQGFLMPTVDFTAFAAATTWGLGGSPVNGMQVATTTSRMDKGFAGPGIYVWTPAGTGDAATTSTWRRLEYGTGMAPALATLSCTSALQPSGIYVSGQALSSTNTILVPVTVTQTGTYNISTPVTNGYSFTGIGTFSATGPQNITLTASGTPTNAGSDNFTLTLGGTTCGFTVKVGAQLAAVSSINCVTTTPATGTYQSTTPTTAANTKVITVAVTNGGAYSFTTNVVNGISFSATGTFADASAGAGNTAGTNQTVTLYASGTPQQAPVTNTFTVSGMGGTTCTFQVPVIAAPVVASLTSCTTPGKDYRIKYSSSANGNPDTWIYPSGDATTAGTNIVITNSGAGVNRQWALMPTGTANEYTLVNGGGTRVLSIASASTSSGASLQLGDYTNGTHQRFVVTPVVAANSTFTLPNLFTLTPSNATGLRMDVTGGSTSNGTQLEVYTNNNSGSQQFYIEPIATILTSGTNVTGTTNRFTVGYTNGNGGTYAQQTVSSTGVQGLTATLTGGVLNGTLGTPAPGFLSFVLSGTPTSAGNAVFAINIGGQSCSVSLPVVLQDATVSSLDCANATTTGTVATGAALSGVSTSVAYTTGNGGKYPAISLNSTGITGLTATAVAGTVATGNGSLVLTISGTPSGDGTAFFALTLGGVSCNVPVTVTRTPVIASFINCGQPAVDYRIKMNDSNYWVYPRLGGTAENTQLALTGTATGANRQWQFIPTSTNSLYLIRNAATGQTVDLSSGSTNNGSTIVYNTYNPGRTATRWNISNVSGTAFAGGIFQLTTQVDGNKAWDVSGTRADDQGIYIFDRDPSNANQRLVLEPVTPPTVGTNITGYNVTLGYNGGNGANYAALSGIQSTGVTGLTLSLAAGQLAGTVATPALGFLTFTVSGTPSAAGTATFAVTVGGQSCTFGIATRGPAAVTAGSLNCNSASTGNLLAGVAASGVTQTIAYTGGNTGQYNLSFPSTGVLGLTATASGSLANGSGSIVLNINGTPDRGGVATFNVSLNGETCSFTRNVVAGTVGSIVNAAQPGLDYRIKAAAGSAWVYPIGGGTTQSTQLGVHTSSVGTNRVWSFVNTGSSYAIINAATNMTMNVSGGPSTSNGNAIIQYPWINTAESLFKLNAISGTLFAAGSVLELVPSYSSTTTNSGVRVDLDNAGLTNDTKLQIWAANSSIAQRYVLERVATLTGGTAASNYRFTLNYTGGTGTYAITSATSTGVTGLTATAAAGSFAGNGGNGFITFTVTGTPSGTGTASFSLVVGGQTIAINLPVN